MDTQEELKTIFKLGIDLKITNIKENFIIDMRCNEGLNFTFGLSGEENPYHDKSEIVDAICAYFSKLEKIRKEKGLSSNA